MRRGIIGFILVGILVFGCSLFQDDDIVKREGEPDVYRVASFDAEMNAAIEQAKESLDTFIEFLNSPRAGQTHFSIKAKFVVENDSDSYEHIWLYDISYDGEQFTGRVGNQPVDAVYLALDELVEVSLHDVSDWMIIEDGVLMGGYTIRVLVDRMNEREKESFLESIDFDIPEVQ